MKRKIIRIPALIGQEAIVLKYFECAETDLMVLNTPIKKGKTWLTNTYEYLFDTKLIYLETLYRYEVRANIEVISEEFGSDYYYLETLEIGEELAKRLRSFQTEQNLIFIKIADIETINKI